MDGIWDGRVTCAYVCLYVCGPMSEHVHIHLGE